MNYTSLICKNYVTKISSLSDNPYRGVYKNFINYFLPKKIKNFL